VDINNYKLSNAILNFIFVPYNLIFILQYQSWSWES